MLVDIGWLVEGPLAPWAREALDRARQGTLARLDAVFPGFTWRVTLVDDERPVPTDSEGARSVMDLLERGVKERDESARDLVVVIAQARLCSPLGDVRLGVISRSLDCAVVTLDALAPRAEAGAAGKVERLAARVEALALRLLGLFCGAPPPPTDSPEWHLAPMRTEEDLDAMRRFDAPQIAAIRAFVTGVADARLEETAPRHSHGAGFLLKGAWINRGDIVSSVVRARPWLFPVRLGKLTTAAVSAIFVFLITAEAWELAASQSAASTVGVTAAVIVATTAYVVVRHGLVRSAGGRATEQRVTTEVSAVLIVLLGLASTYLALLVITLAATTLVFDRALLARWVEHVVPAFGGEHVVVISAFVAAIGLTVGALGASLEDVVYFRYVTFVDEAL